VSDLVAWLTKILDEEELRAPSEHYVSPESALYSCPESRTEPFGDLEWGAGTCDCGLAVRRTRMLADIAAKRAIITRYVEVNDWVTAGHYNDEFASEQIGLETALEILASAYADRPGYDESWRP
jgi:hypothetical protein